MQRIDIPPHNQKELRTEPLLDDFKSSEKTIVALYIQHKVLLNNKIIQYKINVEIFYKIPIKGAIEKDVKHLPMLANPIADATSLNDSMYTKGPFPGIPLAHIP